MEDVMLFNTLRDNVRPDIYCRDYHVHLLCRGGEATFMAGGRRHTIQTGDLAIWQMSNEITDATYSADFDADVLLGSPDFVGKNNPEMAWATRGYLFLRMNPVLRLSYVEQGIIGDDFRQFAMRFGRATSYFRTEAIGLSFTLFLYDLWDICSQHISQISATDRASELFLRFISLVQQQCQTEREVRAYASQLFIAPKYLTQISQQVSGVPASEWIEWFTALELRRLLDDRNLSLTAIADRLRFSSMSFFTRYCKRVLGKTPSEYRK